MQHFIVKIIESILCLVDTNDKKIGQIHPSINFLIEGDVLLENEILIQHAIEYNQKPTQELVEGDVVFINKLCKAEYDVIGTIDTIINDNQILLTDVKQYVFELDTELMEDLVVRRHEIIGRKIQKFVKNIAVKDPNQDIWYGKIEKV